MHSFITDCILCLDILDKLQICFLENSDRLGILHKSSNVTYQHMYGLAKQRTEHIIKTRQYSRLHTKRYVHKQNELVRVRVDMLRSRMLKSDLGRHIKSIYRSKPLSSTIEADGWRQIREHKWHHARINQTPDWSMNYRYCLFRYRPSLGMQFAWIITKMFLLFTARQNIVLYSNIYIYIWFCNVW